MIEGYEGRQIWYAAARKTSRLYSWGRYADWKFSANRIGPKMRHLDYIVSKMAWKQIKAHILTWMMRIKYYFGTVKSWMDRAKQDLMLPSFLIIANLLTETKSFSLSSGSFEGAVKYGWWGTMPLARLTSWETFSGALHLLKKSWKSNTAWWQVRRPVFETLEMLLENDMIQI